MSRVYAAQLRFEPSDHTYWHPDGHQVPSVTQILKATGLARDFEALSGLSPTLERKIAAARQRGTNVHLDTHAWDDRQLNLADVDPALLPYVAAWIECRRNLGLTPVTRERMIYEPDEDYCGTMDGVFTWGPMQYVLVDLKTGDPDDAGCRYQTAAYARAVMRERPDLHIGRRMGIWLTPARRVPYRVKPYDDPYDIETFLSHRQTLRTAA